MSERVIFHIDVNSAFLSWEAVKRLKNGEKLDLRLVPSVIGGDIKSRRGIVSAKSIPTKEYGISTGEPVLQAMRKCPSLIVVPGDYQWYSKCSHAFMDLCREYSEKVEQFSVDECFIDVTALVPAGDKKAAVQLADEIRERIYRELSFTVNVGVSENKFLAKMASDFQKPNRTHTLWKNEISKKMWNLPINEMLFVGKATAPRLKNLGIKTIGEAAKTPLEVLKSHLGERAAIALYEHANGIDNSEVLSEREDEKSYSNARTMPYDLTSREEVYPVLLQLSEMVCQRMLKDNAKASLVSVQVRYFDFNTLSKQKKLSYETYATNLIYEEAIHIFDKIWDGETPIRLLGVSCGNISRGGNEQFNLLLDEKKEKFEKADQMLFDIRSRFGKDSIGRLSGAKYKKDHNGKHSVYDKE